MQQSDCPSLEELRLFDAGSVSDEDRFAELASHLEICPECLREMAAIHAAPGDSTAFSPRPSEAEGDSRPVLFEAEAECARALALVEALPRRCGDGGLPETIGAYKILDLLGQGGMGVTYKAWHQHLKRVVALKLIGHAQANNPDCQARFAIEQEIVGKLNHPNIATAYDAGVHEGTPFLVLEYVEGLNLYEILRLEQTLSVAEASYIAREIALGLHYIHEAGFIHRDIKPANIVMTADHKVKILDFGLALGMEEPDTLENEGLAGTANFRAPEQTTAGTTIDRKADLYSLGATLFALLTGSAPQSPTSQDCELRYKHSDNPSDPIPPLPDAVPRELSDLVQSLLAHNPDGRPADAGKVAELLKKFAADPTGGISKSEVELPRRFTADIPEARRGTRDGPVNVTTLGVVATSAVLLLVLVTGASLLRQSFRIDLNQSVGKVAVAPTPQSVTKTGSDLANPSPTNTETIQSSKSDVVQIERAEQPIKHAGSNAVATASKLSAADSMNWKPGANVGQLGGLVLMPAVLPNVRRWQIETRLPRGAIKCLAWDAQELRLACASDDGHVRIFERSHDPAGPKLIFSHSLPFNGCSDATFRCLSWNSATDSLLIGDSHRRSKIHLWRVTERQLVLDFKAHTTGTADVGWSPDGSRFISAGLDGHARIWDSQRQLKGDLALHRGEVTSIAWHPTRPLVATGGADHVIRLWDSTTCRQLAELNCPTGPILSLAWHPSQNYLASGDPEAVRIWNLDLDITRAPINVVDASIPDGIKRVVWNIDGSQLATAGRDVIVWSSDLREHHSIYEGKNDETVCAMTWGSQSGKLTFAPMHGVIREWDPEQQATSVLLNRSAPQIKALICSPDGSRWAVQSNYGTIHILDRDGAKQHSFANATNESDTGYMAWNADGTLLATSTQGALPKIQVSHISSEKVVSRFKLPSTATCLTWLGQRDQLITGHADGSIRAWNLDRLEQESLIFTHPTAVSLLECSRPGHLVAVGDIKGIVTILKVPSEGSVQKIGAFPLSSLPVSSLSWNQAGSMLAGNDGQGLFMVDASKRTEVWRLGPLEGLGSVAWSSDDTRLYVGGLGATEIGEYRAQPTSNLHERVAASPRARHLADADQFGVLRLRVGSKHRPQCSAALVDDQNIVVVDVAGQLHESTTAVSSSLIYLVEAPANRVQTLTFKDFADKFPGTIARSKRR